VLEQGKPEKIIDKIVEGKLDRFYSEICLIEQAFIKDPDRKVGDLLRDAVARMGENIQVRRFMRYQVGEGVEK
jgi:elongation factor Ts